MDKQREFTDTERLDWCLLRHGAINTGLRKSWNGKWRASGIAGLFDDPRDAIDAGIMEDIKFNKHCQGSISLTQN